MKTEPLPAAQALETYFLEARSKLLDLAATLDRIGRGGGAFAVEDDPRLEKVRQRWRCCKTAAAAGRNGYRRYFRSIMILHGNGRGRAKVGSCGARGD